MRTTILAGLIVAGACLASCSKETAAPAATPNPEAAATAPGAAPIAPTSDADMHAAIARHVAAVKAGDVDAVLADYADDAILVSPPGMVTPAGTFVGKAKVRDFFVWLATPEIIPGARSMVTTDEVVGPNTVLFHWTQFPGTPKQVKGYDVFVFRGGKIIFQTTAPNP